MKCLRSVEGILNLIISNSSADFAALSASLFRVYQDGLESSRYWLFYPDWKHNNNCTIYPRCMNDQYSYYKETLNWKYCKMCIFSHLYILKSKFSCLCFGWKYSRLIWESSGKYVFINYCGSSHFVFVFWTISVNLNSILFPNLEFC